MSNSGRGDDAGNTRPRSGSDRSFFDGLGPPDPISYLRNVPNADPDRSSSAQLEDYYRRYDSDDEGPILESPKKVSPKKKYSTIQRNEANVGNSKTTSSSSSASVNNEQRRATEDPPARERPSDGSAWPYRETLSFTRSLIFYGAGSITSESEHACRLIEQARKMRQYYHGNKGVKLPHGSAILKDSSAISFKIGPSGVAELYHEENGETQSLVVVPTIKRFFKDYNNLVEIVTEGAMRSFCFQRLQMLSTSYKMHTTINGTIERQEQSNLLGTDFYRTLKIDNHIHAAAAPSAKQFVEFVRDKLQNEGDTVVFKNGDETKTLAQVYQEAGLDMDHLTIDAFDVMADYSVYKRFDTFNDKYSPFRLADMRRIFLKTNNHIEGRYFAELLKIVIDRHEKSKGHNSACELRLSVYGMERHEWQDLARWVLTDWKHPDFPGNLISTHNRWHIQIPRLWRIYSSKPVVDGQPKRSFLEMVENLFVPVFEATLRPDEHPELSEFLKHVVAFDSVDDEGALEEVCSCHHPHEWTSAKNPSYWWQLYYLWANIEVLNHLRSARGLNTFAFRPHAGETGDPMHLAATYMLCSQINHGVGLDNQVSLQYLYYLDQVGMSMSPLSNNYLFTKIAENPFAKFFRRGMNVTLSTDDPLLFHMSDDALLEEYSVARATFDLSMTDMMEIARNSVLQSGFEDKFKERWLGKDYKRGLTFCDEKITHVPLIRAKFRAEHLALEHMMVHLIAAGKGDAVLQEMKVQFGLARDAHRDVLFENFEEVPTFPERNQL